MAATQTRRRKPPEPSRVDASPTDLVATVTATNVIAITVTIPAGIAELCATAAAHTIRDGLGGARARGAALDVLRGHLTLSIDPAHQS